MEQAELACENLYSFLRGRSLEDIIGAATENDLSEIWEVCFQQKPSETLPEITERDRKQWNDLQLRIEKKQIDLIERIHPVYYLKLANVCVELGNRLRNEDREEEAQYYFQKAIDATEHLLKDITPKESNDYRLLIWFNQNQAESYEKLGDLKAAEIYRAKAKALQQEHFLNETKQ